MSESLLKTNHFHQNILENKKMVLKKGWGKKYKNGSLHWIGIHISFCNDKKHPLQKKSDQSINKT
jgi:hypothetical protein